MAIIIYSAGMSIHFNFERIPWCRGSPGSGQLAASAVVVKSWDDSSVVESHAKRPGDMRRASMPGGCGDKRVRLDMY